MRRIAPEFTFFPPSQASHTVTDFFLRSSISTFPPVGFFAKILAGITRVRLMTIKSDGLRYSDNCKNFE